MNSPNEVDTPAHLLHELARESLVERRRARRWSIFFRSITLLFLVGVAFFVLRGERGASLNTSDAASQQHTALINISGVIAPDTQASIEPVRRALDRAFANPETAGIVLQINSPGGSPVQSGLLYDYIVAQRELHPDVPVHAVLGDIAASGGYYIAAAAQNIYANRASIVGSIGVRLDSFGAVDAIERLGIERRLLTAGDHKGLLDPFEPVDDVAVARLQSMLDNVHTQFISAVTTGRGTRLADDPTLFSGLIWSGEEAMANGLIDALASTQEVASDVIGAERVVNYTEQEDPLTRIRRELGIYLTALANNVINALSNEQGMGKMQIR